MGSPAGWATRLFAAANRPVPADSVAVLRILLGLTLAFASARFLSKGWVDTLYVDPVHHLSYVGFEWVRPLPAPWMHIVVACLGALGICIAVGYRHRLAAVLFLAGFSYVELIDAALYLNHYWFVTLAVFLLALLPVDRHWSLDARSGRRPRSDRVPVGVVWALRAQLAVVYVFAGIGKLNGDWLLRAQPMRLWLADRTDTPLVGPVLDEPVVAFAASWAGALFDCSVVALLLWRRTRIWAWLAVVAFHLSTGALFQIGVFPVVMIAGSLVFFEPDWPRRLASRLEPMVIRSAPASAALRRWSAPGRRGGRPQSGPAPILTRAKVAVLVMLAVAQLVLPLRHLAYPGDVRWNEQGYYGSWRVMLTEKAGTVEFALRDPASGRQWTVGPEVVLTDWQAVQAAVRPDLLHATAHLLADHYDRRGVTGVEVRARAWVSMNGRPARLLVDPEVDLAAEPRTLAPSEWILKGP